MYWAYDDSITKETDPNCAKWFSINGTRHPVAECKVPDVQVDGLSVFQFKTNYGSISVAAVDSEGVSSPAVASGQAVPPATYVIKYDGNGADGGTAPTSQSKTQYTDITLATNSGGLTRIGYRFTGWNTDPDGAGTTYSAGATYSADEGVTLYAQWEAVDAVVLTPESSAVNHGATVTLTPPTRDATIYYQIGGTSEVVGTPGQPVTVTLYNASHSPSSATGVAAGIPEGGSVTLTAHAKYADGTQSEVTTGTYSLNQYAVGYEGNGNGDAVDNVPALQTFYSGGSVAIGGGANRPVRIGYRFTGWNTDPDGAGTTYSAGATYSADESETLYAQWEAVDAVTFSRDGAVNSRDTVQLTPPKAEVTIYYSTDGGQNWQQGQLNQSVTINLYNEKSMPQSQTGVDVGIPEDDSVTITAYAKYADGIQSKETTGTYRLNQYTVSYDGNGYTGGTVPSPDTFYSGGSVTIQSGNGLTKTGHTFTAWKGNDGQSYSPNNTYSDNSNLILTAQWQAITYTVSYDLNEGTGDVPDPSTVTLGSSVTVGQGSLTRVGYIFNGWNTQKNGQGDKYTQGQQFTPKADTTLYAQWQVGAIINSADEAQAAINEALDAAQDGDEILIKLGANLTGNTVQGGAVIDVLSIDTTRDVSITIDGGGHTINANGNGRGLRVDAKNATVTVKNITLTGANHNTDGGGIFFLDGKQLILDSGTIITGNTLTGTNSHGGGIYVGNSNATVIIKDNVTISDNEAVNGGGLCLSGSKTTVVMEGGTFSGNTARGNGGAVYIGDNPPTGGTVRFTMKDGVFNGTNSATKGGNHIAVDQGMQEEIFVFHKDIGGKSTTRDGHSMIEVYTAHTETGFTSYVTDSTWETDDGFKMGDLK